MFVVLFLGLQTTPLLHCPPKGIASIGLVKLKTMGVVKTTGVSMWEILAMLEILAIKVCCRPSLAESQGGQKSAPWEPSIAYSHITVREFPRCTICISQGTIHTIANIHMSHRIQICMDMGEGVPGQFSRTGSSCSRIPHPQLPRFWGVLGHRVGTAPDVIPTMGIS